MSHFCVLVRVPAARVPDYEQAIAEMLLPYKELGCGSDDPPELQKYLVFQDRTEECQKEYEEEDAETKSKYPTFEAYMQEHHGYRQHEGKWGYWKNPNQKWDWYSIGGRWTGFLAFDYEPTEDKDNYKTCWLCRGTGTRNDHITYDERKEHDFARKGNGPFPCIGKGCNACYGSGHELKHPSDWKQRGNLATAGSIHERMPSLLTKQKENADAFWGQWLELVDGKEWDIFEGPRDLALDLGMIECKDTKELTGQEWKTWKWKRQDVDRCDVYKNVSREEFARFEPVFFPLRTYAMLTEKGWSAKGEMGWFGCDFTDGPDAILAYSQAVIQELQTGNPADLWVVVDCHI